MYCVTWIRDRTICRGGRLWWGFGLLRCACKLFLEVRDHFQPHPTGLLCRASTQYKMEKRKVWDLSWYSDSKMVHGHLSFVLLSFHTVNGTATNCDGDTLHCQKAPHIWRWGHLALAKSPSYMATGTLCTAKKPLIYGDGDTLYCQKAPHIR